MGAESAGAGVVHVVYSDVVDVFVMVSDDVIDVVDSVGQRR